METDNSKKKNTVSQNSSLESDSSSKKQWPPVGKPEEPGKEKTSYREHKNPVVRFFARFAFSVWVIVMAIGLLLALIVSFMLV